MFAIALIAIVIVAVVARLVTVVMNDRPLTAPRSHTHELDPQSTRLDVQSMASDTLGIWIVLPSTTFEFSDRPFAAARERVVKPFAAAIDHSDSPG